VIGVIPQTYGTRAFLYSEGRFSEIGNLGYNPRNGPNSTANDINNYGQIVGVSSTTALNGQSAYMYQNGSMMDLFKVIPKSTGWTAINSAVAINNNGQIVGIGINNGQSRGYIMTPIK
jgi:probable HAF family extracellular repeat protein